ncbi:MAG TPA: L,D-transpeptidase family protein [Ramlibacter sp.]
MLPLPVRKLLLALCLWGTAALALAQLQWFEAGRPTADAMHAAQVLAAAGEHGLEPADYAAPALQARLTAAAQDPVPGDVEQRVLGQALTAALQRYLSDLQRGRVDPRQFHAGFNLPRRRDSDTLSLLRDALAARRLPQALRQAAPALPMYEGLRLALARYRALAGHPAWSSRLPPLPARKLVPGQPYPGLRVLAQRLEALGDLTPGYDLPERFDAVLVAALRAFQERHGLTPDGVLGAGTLRELEVVPADRARQIELAMERLRWTPLMQGPRVIAVNIPEFVLRAYEVGDNRVDVRLTMKVIVGKALRTRTPLLTEAMRFIEFSPYWNVPPSIARDETVPRLRRDPGYLEREGLEFVTASGKVVTTLAPSHLDAVLRGSWRIRQRPGPQNALGGIKFVFPNNANIYLHDTPARRLFERERRDFSHGCIRLEAPVALAQFVLRDEPGWAEERIREAMGTGVSTTVRLQRPVPVLIAYSTVVARAGTVYFFRDLYRHDAVLDRALRQRAAALPPLAGRAGPVP